MAEEKKWYVVNTYSGHESKVKDKLEMRAESMDMQDNIFRIIIPGVEEVEKKDGVEKKKFKKLFPGYIMVEMIMSDDAWYIVRNTPGVTGFIGSSGKGAKPIPLSEQEVDKVLKTMGQTRDGEELKIEVGAKVKIVDGPFEGMFGKIKTLNDDQAVINIDLFGQVTEVEANVNEIELEI